MATQTSSSPPVRIGYLRGFAGVNVDQLRGSAGVNDVAAGGESVRQLGLGLAASTGSWCCHRLPPAPAGAVGWWQGISRRSRRGFGREPICWRSWTCPSGAHVGGACSPGYRGRRDRRASAAITARPAQSGSGRATDGAGPRTRGALPGSSGRTVLRSGVGARAKFSAAAVSRAAGPALCWVKGPGRVHQTERTRRGQHSSHRTG